ncbi:MAG: hypothetical protein A3G20_00030, partial [Acidobacteria bacterium RIFCSPLOWO2_12_FULL_59_11]
AGEKLGAAGYHAVAFDARGHGDSDWASDGLYGQDAMVEDLKCVVAALGNRRPVLVPGARGPRRPRCGPAAPCDGLRGLSSGLTRARLPSKAFRVLPSRGDMAERKLILPAELKMCATCAYWDGVRRVDEDVRVVVVCESCQGECLVREALTPSLGAADEDCLWDEISGEDAGARLRDAGGGATMGLIPPGSEPPLTVTSEDTVLQAARAMTARRVGAATVLDGARIVGVVTERDVLQKVVAAGLDPAATRVRDVMSSPAVSIEVNTSVASAAALMRKHHIRHLVVLDENEALVGMLALRYVLYDLMDDMERKVGDLVGYIMADGPGG